MVSYSSSKIHKLIRFKFYKILFLGLHIELLRVFYEAFPL